jgi:hypothetical protein
MYSQEDEDRWDEYDAGYKDGWNDGYRNLFMRIDDDDFSPYGEGYRSGYDDGSNES